MSKKTLAKEKETDWRYELFKLRATSSLHKEMGDEAVLKDELFRKHLDVNELAKQTEEKIFNIEDQLQYIQNFNYDKESSYFSISKESSLKQERGITHAIYIYFLLKKRSEEWLQVNMNMKELTSTTSGEYNINFIRNII